MRRPGSRARSLVAALLLAGAAGMAARAQDLFTPVTAAQGVAFTHHYPGADDLDMGAGGAWGDFDGDGDPDLYVADRSGANELFRNRGGGAGFDAVAAAYGIQAAAADSTGALWGDYDNDGDADLYVMNRGANILYRNDGPGGSGEPDWIFTDVTADASVMGSVECDGRTSAAVWGDYDNDGWLDLLVGNHHFDFTKPEDDAPNENRADCLLHNEEGAGGERVFVDKATQMFTDGVLHKSLAHSVGFLDHDDDGDLDILIVNEVMAAGLEGNLFWRNNSAGASFTNVTSATGTGLASHPMGLAVGDFNHDGALDFALSDLQANHLYQNTGSNSFTKRDEAAAGLDDEENHVSWGLLFLDYDLDGWLDLYIADGTLSSGSDPNRLFHNDGDPPNNTFTEVTDVSGCDDAGRSRTAIRADYDGDGDDDIYVVNLGGNARLCRNDQTGGDFLALKLVGSVSNRDAIGARVKVTPPAASGLPDQHRFVQSGSTTGGGHELKLTIGVTGVAEVDSVEIDWPSGLSDTIDYLATNQTYRVDEGLGVMIFADGFESGDLSGWSAVGPP